MKTFSRILSEVAQPNSEDELNFKEKHVIDPIDHTVAPESTFSGAVDKDDIDGMKRYRKNKRLADYQKPEDEDVYEGVSLTRDLPGQEDDDIDNDGDEDMTDAQYKYRKRAQIKKYKIDETVYVIPEQILATEKNAFHTAAANAHASGKKHFAFAGKKYPVTMTKDAAKTFAGKGEMSEAMDPVGKEDDDINNDGKVNKSDKYLHGRRKAISASIRNKIKEGFGSVTAAGGDHDEEESHQRYKKSNSPRKTTNIGVNKLSYAAANAEAKPKSQVSLKKAPWNEEVDLDESYTLYHPSYTSAINTALNHHKDLTVSGEDRDNHIASGPRKPSEGKTVSHNIPATDKAGNPHMIHIQVYNKGGDKPFELNTYSSKVPKKRMKEEVELDEAGMPSSVIKSKQKYSQMSDKDFADSHGDKPEAKLQSMAWSHGYGKGSNEYVNKVKRGMKTEDINEAFSAGSVKLNDGSSVLVKAQDAKLLNDLMNGLRPENAKKMMKVAMTDKHGFNEILGFAREAL